jgi:hypothetical protein
MSGWQAFRAGLGRTFRYPQVWMILFAVNLLSALALATVPAMGLASGLGHRPAMQDAADGVDAWYVVETLPAPLSEGVLGGESMPSAPSPGAPLAILLGTLAILALPLVVGLPSAFVSGGLLLTYVEAPRPFRWRRFLWGGWHWWGAFVLLALIQGILVLLVVGPMVGAGVGIVAAAGSAAAWAVVPLLGLVGAAGLALVELCRAFAVAEGTRNLFQALGQAARYLVRHPLAVGGLYLLSLLGVAVLHALFRLGLLPLLPLDWWPLVLLVQQTFVLLRLGTRLARLAGVVALIGVPVSPAEGQPVAGIGRAWPVS